jgi:hypothetical protein
MLAPDSDVVHILILRLCTANVKPNDSASLFEANSVVESTTALTTTAEAVPEALATLGSGDRLLSLASPYADPEMQRVLSRKYRIATLSWADTDAAGTVLAQLDLMDLLVNIPNIADKLTQFRWITSDMEVEIRLNATPFHIGSLLIGHIPRVTSSEEAFSLLTQKTANLAQISQAQGIVMSASTTNNATMSIKREAATLFDPIDAPNSYAGALGNLTIAVLNPLILASAGSVNPVTITVFAAFVNPHPAGFGYFPTISDSDTAVPQSDEVHMESVAKAVGSVLAPEATSLFSPKTVVGDVSAVGKALTDGLSAAAQFLPLLGLSKPVNQVTPQPAVVDDFRDLNYTHGVAQTTKSSAHPNAGLGAPMASFLKKNKIRDVIAVPTLLMTAQFDKTDDPATPLIWFPVHPSLCWFDPTSKNFQPSHLAYVSQGFRFWRGGMKLRFHFVTSQFVSARLRIALWPANTYPANIEEYAGDAVSKIVDVRGETIVDFLVPYQSPHPYQPCRGYIHPLTEQGWGNVPADEMNSFVTLSLINPLQQPDFSGNALVYCNVFVAAAEDFTFGGLLHPYVRPVCAIDPGLPASKAKPQSLIEVKDDEEAVPQSLVTSFSVPFDPIIPAAVSAEQGAVLPEQFSTIEGTLMKYTSTGVPSPVLTVFVPITDVRIGKTTDVNTYADAIEFYRQIFRWHRGGIRFKMLPTPATVAQLAADPTRRFNVIIGFPTEDVGDPPTLPSAWITPSDNQLRGVVETEIPWLYGTYVCTNWAAGCQIDLPVNELFYEFGLFQGGTGGITAGVYRSVSDDFMFGHVLPTPTLENPFEVETLSKVPQPFIPRLDQSLGAPNLELRSRRRK